MKKQIIRNNVSDCYDEQLPHLQIIRWSGNDGASRIYRIRHPQRTRWLLIRPIGKSAMKDTFRDVKLQALIEEGLANNVDMQQHYLLQEAKVMLGI